MNKTKKAVLYIHGKGGYAGESEHYIPLFPDCAVTGLDYKTFTPWETGYEIRGAVTGLKEKYDEIIIVANSIGAFFCMNAGICDLIKEAFFISPVVDMQKLIEGMMAYQSVAEKELQEKGEINDLSWEYLCYVREHPVKWTTPTHILYGENDALTSYETIREFADKTGSSLLIMKGGEHWFHTDEQMRFLDDWIKNIYVRGDRMKNNIAYCGLDCEKCEAYTATQNNDDILRKKVAKEWSELNHVQITPEMINCDGCRADGRKTPFCESLCPIRQCGLEKGFETCGNCESLQNCEKVAMIIKINAEALDNLRK